MDQSTSQIVMMQSSGAPPLPPGPAPLAFPQGPPPPQPLWHTHQLRHHLSSLFEKLSLLKAVTKELEASISLKEAGATLPHNFKLDPFGDVQQSVASTVEMEGSDDSELEPLAREAARGLRNSIAILLAPLQAVANGNARWEEMAAATRLSDKRLKMRRNRRWRQKKRHKAAEFHRKEQEYYVQVDSSADNWRARELAKDIASRQMEKMKEVAERKAKEERLRLQEELEQVLLVEKLQELRALRIQKLKKQGRFFPEEDNQFMNRVRAAVEEEERQAAAAADTSAAALAIASAGKASRTTKSLSSEMMKDHEPQPTQDKEQALLPPSQKQHNQNATQGIPISHSLKGAQDSFCGLPPEYYHYYYGSSTDMGTLIEVRQNWDTFIMSGGSRIPGHWIQAPVPSDSTWASFLVKDSRNRVKPRL